MTSLNLKRLKKIKFSFGLPKNLSTESGVYIFWHNQKILYIGKAKNIKERLKSYLTLQVGPKTKDMLKNANFLSIIKTENEIQSLLLEANLIRNYQPKYNTIAKDDKSPLYIVITKEEYPRVLMARKDKLLNINFTDVYGPFPSSGIVKNVYSMLRKTFPFSTHKIGKLPCLQSQINLCSPCPNFIYKLDDKILKKVKKSEYLRNIKHLRLFLDGNYMKVLRELLKEIKYHSNNLDYEEAMQVKRQIERIKYITQPIKNPSGYLENPNLLEDIRNKEILSLKRILFDNGSNIKNLDRIECFDVSHHAGNLTTASMIVFEKGIANKNLYRHFKIYQNIKFDDISSLEEVAKRRLIHIKDWGEPDLIVVDGGINQLKAFKKYFDEKNITCVSLEKKTETLIIPVFLKKEGILIYKKVTLSASPGKYLIQRIRDESHRFAQRYHHILVSKLIKK